MAKYRCTVCNYVYDDAKEQVKFSDLPKEWVCPICGAPKSAFVLLEEQETAKAPEKKTESTVSDVLVNQLAAWGVKYVFSIPGTSTLGIIDAIRNTNGKVRYIQVRHEESAAFMASAYGKLTGHVAATLSISGPGTTNLATGLYDAQLDHAPVLALTGMVPRKLMGSGTLQEIDHQAFFEPFSVYNKTLMTEDQTTLLATLAIKHALLDQGVAHIGIPNDVQKLPYEAELLPFEGRMPNLAYGQEDWVIEKAAKVIDSTKRPILLVGHGARGQGTKLLKLAQKIGAPILSTFKGKGIVDANEPLYVGCHGGIGSTTAAELMEKTDLMIVVGVSFSDLTQIPQRRMVQIDINPLMIARRYPAVVSLLGNSAVLIPKLTEKVAQRDNKDYLAEISRLKQNWLAQIEKEADPTAKPIRPPYVIKVLNEKIADNAVITLDVGENCWWFGRNFNMKKTQKLAMSGNLATMGFGLPAALAAKLAYPERQVVCLTGDGGLTMVLGDFLTALKYNLAIKVFVFNNKNLGMIMQEQKVEGYMRWQTELHDFNFAAFAENAGGLGIKVTEPAELEAAVDRALNSEKPAIVDVDVDAKRFHS
ncbi:MAG: thiamine pyrophosphate-dependent enzyme [Candidatus Bathyarchaeia archaeon]|jgi:thiamine pyrophosphate-dependent acetolactate synthase large subunit-like protein/rubredoxin